MTNPIALGSSIASSPASAIAAGKAGASDASGFAILLESALGETKGTQANALGSALTAPATSVEPIDLDALSETLGDLLSLLTGLEAGIKDDQPLDPEALDTLASLLETVTELLDNGAVIDPDSPLLTQLQEVAQSLGIDIEGGAGPASALETLSALATRIGAELRENAPQLANALTEFARKLDAQIASIETALANAQPDASIRLKLVESETKANPSAAIAQTASEKTASAAQSTPEPLALQTDKGTRSLTGADDQNQSRPSATNASSNAQATAATAASAAATASEAQTEAPDGLTIPPGQTTATNAAPGGLRPETAAYARPEPRINMPHIAVEIARSIQNGVSRFEIRLNPPELGRIDVRLEMDAAGNVTARLAVEKSETLDLLQRDQRALEKALADAGLDSNKTDLEFSLRQENGQDEQAEARQSWKASVKAEPDMAGDLAPPPPAGAMRGYARLDAVNLWV